MAELRRAVALISAFFVLVSLRLPARAAQGFSPALSEEHGSAGDVVELSLPYDGSFGGIGTFLVRVEFDPQVLEYKRTRESALIRDAYTVTQTNEDWIGSGYVQKQQGNCLSQPGETFSYRFRVRDDAPGGETSLRVSVYQIASPDGEVLSGTDAELSYTVDPPPSSEAGLEALIPSAGTLTPEFSPDRLEYDLTVPFEVTFLSFSATAAQGASWKVNRKNLGAGGSDTAFLVTVTAEDGKTKIVYRIVAHREEKKDAASKPTPAPESSVRETQKPEAAAKPARTPAPSRSPKAAKTPRPTATPKARSSSAPAVTETEETPLPPVIYKSGSDFTMPMALILVAIVFSQVLTAPLSKWLSEKVSRHREEPKDEDDGEDGPDDS